MAKNSPKKIATNNAWTNAHYDRINLAIPKGQKEVIQAAAAASGEKSVNAWIGKAIEARLSGTPAPAPAAQAQGAPVDGLAVEAFQEDLDKMREHLEVFGLNEKKFLRRAIYKQILMDRKTKGFNAPIDEDDENAMNLVNRV